MDAIDSLLRTRLPEGKLPLSLQVKRILPSGWGWEDVSFDPQSVPPRTAAMINSPTRTATHTMRHIIFFRLFF